MEEAVGIFHVLWQLDLAQGQTDVLDASAKLQQRENSMTTACPHDPMTQNVEFSYFIFLVSSFMQHSCIIWCQTALKFNKEYDSETYFCQNPKFLVVCFIAQQSLSGVVSEIIRQSLIFQRLTRPYAICLLHPLFPWDFSTHAVAQGLA